MTKILVFESEPAFAWELRTELGRLGCTVQIVDDGNAGLQSAANDRPDLILLSIELPRMNGFSVCNKLKKDPQLKDVPLIIMSSDSSEETFEQHRRLKTRAEDYVRKPIALGELVTHIRQLIPLAAAIESEAILIDEPLLFDDDVEDLAAPPPPDAPQPGAKTASSESEIDDFLGGAFDRLIGDEEPKAVPSARKEPRSLTPDPPTIPAPPIPVPVPPPIVLAPLPPPPPPPRPASVPPPPRSVGSKGPATARSAPPPPSVPVIDAPSSDASDAGVIEQLRIDLARVKEENTRLQTALDASRSNVQFLEARALEPQQDPEEIIRLKHEVEELKSKLAVANAPARSGASRELLDLREALNKKDKEIVFFRDQLTAKDKELLDLRDSTLGLEREKADLSDQAADMTERIAEFERTNTEVSAKIEKLKEDRYVLGMRAENFEVLTTKLESRLMAHEADAVSRIQAAEARAQTRVAEIEATLAEAQKAKEEATAALEKVQAEVADGERRLAEAAKAQEAEREKLVAEHAALVVSLNDKHVADVKALNEKHVAEVKALNDEHAEAVDAAHETEIANLRQEHATEIEQLKAQVEQQGEKVRQENHQALETLKSDQAAQIEALTKNADERLAARNREFADEWVRGAAELEALHAEARKKAEHDAAERVRSELVEHYENKLKALESKHATALEALRAERDRAVEDLDAKSRSAMQELDRYVIGLGADLQDTRIKLEEIEEQRAALEIEVGRLEGERSSQAAQLERVEKELRSSRADMVTLGAEKDRFVAEAIASASRLAKLRTRWEQERLTIEHTREALTQAASRLQEIESHPIEDVD